MANPKDDDTQNPAQSQSRLKDLISRGKEQGYLTYAEVNDHLPDDISDPDQVEDIIQMINDMGIGVFEVAPDTESLLMEGGDAPVDEAAVAEAAAALVAVENETGRTTDPVRMYMREMGTVELLTREGEIDLAMRIEEGLREMMNALAYFPGTVERVINEYDMVVREERRLVDILSGYLDPATSIPTSEEVQINLAAKQSAQAAKQNKLNNPSDDDDESGMGDEEPSVVSMNCAKR